MKDFFKYIFADRIIKWTSILSGLLLLIGLTYTGLTYVNLPPFVPLFNQLPWGQERLGMRPEIFLPQAITVVFLLLNFFLINYLYGKMPLVSRILGVTVLLVTILSFIFNLQTLHIIL